MEDQHKILIPDFTQWTTKEPNIDSAKRKNDAGLCAMHECQNKITNPDHRCPYGMICEDHAKSQEEMLERWEKEMWLEYDKRFIDLLMIAIGHCSGDRVAR